MRYYYQIYGLFVESEIKMEEAYETDANHAVDVRILETTIDEEVKTNIKQGKRCDFSFERSYLSIPEVGTYVTTNGDTIFVEKEENANMQMVKSYILGSMFGILMTYRNCVVIHGGGIAIDNRGIIVTGTQGAGKSTTCDALLRQKNSFFVSDDVCALSKKENGYLIQMGYPQQKLCREAAKKAGYQLEDLIYINEQRDKFAKRLTEGFLVDGAPLTAIYEICMAKDKQLTMQELTGHQKLMCILTNLYRAQIVFAAEKMPVAYMQQCLQIVEQVPVYRICRPENADTTQQITELINNTIQNK